MNLRDNERNLLYTQKKHEDHIAGKGFTSMTHYNLVRKFIPMPQAVKIPDAKAAVYKEWKKLGAIPAWQLDKVKRQRDKKKVHFATLMDMCHLKNAEAEPELQKYKGRVVLREDIGKDDSGAYAVFTEQGSSASQMTAAKIVDVIARLLGCDGQAADAVSAYTQVELEDAPRLQKKSKIRMSRCLDTSSTTQMAQIMGKFEDTGEEIPNWECMFVHRKQGLLLSCRIHNVRALALNLPKQMVCVWVGVVPVQLSNACLD